MNRHKSLYFTLLAALLLFAGCEKDAKGPEEAQFSSPPEVSATTLLLSADTESEPVITISWPEVKFPERGPVKYVLQFARPADATETNAWPNAIRVAAGADVLSKSFQGGAFNKLALDLGLEPGMEGTMVVGVVAEAATEVYSQPVSIQVTPYMNAHDYPALWVAGDFQGWDISKAGTIVSENNDQVYEGYIYFPPGGTNEIKLYAQPDWAPLSYGDGGDGTVIVANYAGANFTAPSDGYYLFAVDLNKMTYILMKTSWGIIGSATPGGWDADTPMTYNRGTQTWSVTTDMKAGGSFKFRANNEWQLDFGIDENENLAYANHPWRTYIDQPQLTVPEDGNYTITLDLHVPGNYTYTIVKN